MRALVTGGTGFVGGALVRALVASGAQVRVLARPTSQTEALEALGVEIVRGDILIRKHRSRARRLRYPLPRRSTLRLVGLGRGRTPDH